VLTPYITEFLLDARDEGFAVPEAVLQKALERLSEDLLTGSVPFYGYDHREHLRFAYQAHSGYVLARVNRAPLGTLRALFDNERKKAITPLPLLHLGVALGLQGDKARGAKAVAAAFALKDERPDYLGDYGTRIRDEALIAMLAKRWQLKAPEAEPRLLALSKDLSARNASGWVWYSTQEMVALARLGKLMAAGMDPARTLDGTLVVGERTLALGPGKLDSRRFDYAQLQQGLRYAPKSEGTLYVQVDVAGIPRNRPAVDTRKMSVARSYWNPDGSAWKGGDLKEGQVLVVELKVETSLTMPDALLVDLLPAGLEVENLNLTPPEQWADIEVDGVSLDDRGSAATLVHEEYRDDRYVAALKLEGGEAKLFYLVRAVTPGSYVVPPPQLEDMYRPELRAIGKVSPESIRVVQP
jgi:uncharacterized protein YfaS (alpha-2-macroglobulin family)